MNEEHKTTEQKALDSQPVFTFVQLARFGDLLQVTQAIESLKKERENIRLRLVARERFASPLSFYLEDFFDEVFYLPKDIIPSGKDDLENKFDKVKSVISLVNQTESDAVVNLSFSRTSAYLSTLIKAKHHLGLAVEPDNQISVNDNWSQYLYSNVLGGDLNPFNLVDLFRFIIGCNENSHQKPSNSEVKNIVLHPFGSHKRKAWKAEKWVEVVFKLMKSHSDIRLTVVGGEADKQDSLKILEHPLVKNFSSRIINQVGKFSLQQTFENVEQQDLMIGHDSMVSHIAALKGVQTITIPLGTVRPMETAPYLDGSIVLAPQTDCFPCQLETSCDYFKCHSDVPYQIVTDVISGFIKDPSGKEVVQLANTERIKVSSVRIYQARFTEIGAYVLEDLSKGRSVNAKETFRNIARVSWLYILSEQEEKNTAPILSSKAISKLSEVYKGIEFLFELCEFGKKYSRFILEEISEESPDLEKIKEFSTKVDEIDQLLTNLKITYPDLYFIIDFLTVRKANLSGDNLISLSENSFYAFHTGSMLSSACYEMLQSLLNAHKPGIIGKNQEA